MFEWWQKMIYMCLRWSTQNGWKKVVRFKSRKIWFESMRKNKVKWKKYPKYEKYVSLFESRNAWFKSQAFWFESRTKNDLNQIAQNWHES